MKLPCEKVIRYGEKHFVLFVDRLHNELAVTVFFSGSVGKHYCLSSLFDFVA